MNDTTLYVDRDTVVDTQRGEQRAGDLHEGDVIREFGDDIWYRVIEDQGDGDTCELLVTAVTAIPAD